MIITAGCTWLYAWFHYTMMAFELKNVLDYISHVTEVLVYTTPIEHGHTYFDCNTMLSLTMEEQNRQIEISENLCNSTEILSEPCKHSFSSKRIVFELQ